MTSERGGFSLAENDSSASDQRESGAQQSGQPGGASDQPSARLKVSAAVRRFAGLGIELAGFTLAVAGIGYVLDSIRGHDKPYATALGTLIGFTLGMVRFIHEVRKIED